MTPELKSQLRAEIIKHNPCKSALSKFDAAEGNKVYEVMLKYGEWCEENCVEIPKLPDDMTSIGGYCYLRGYTHPLPASLTSIGGVLLP